MNLDQKENEMETLKRNVTRKEGEIKSINEQKQQLQGKMTEMLGLYK